MIEDFEPAAKILEAWVVLSDFRGLSAYLPLYIKNGILSSPSDLYKLTPRHLYSLPDISEDEISDVQESVERCKDIGISRALLALLPDLEPDTVQEITSSACSIPELVERCKDSEFVDGLGEELERLTQVGVSLSFREDSIFDEMAATPFTDKRVVIAGTLSAEHDVVKSALEAMGATVGNKVTEDTDMLLAGDGSQEEVYLAAKYGTKIITEQNVGEMLGA